ncbi:unnamed protein product [Moneuplotes crassus]|uniref:Chromo domain-containing protein n=1 Tax=Euplotes crassus TaxID=5936 RepID=A0AAD1XEQ2_EUPCR|nr:unnamed protein product [Moneuplotes crassus]
MDDNVQDLKSTKSNSSHAIMQMKAGKKVDPLDYPDCSTMPAKTLSVKRETSSEGSSGEYYEVEKVIDVRNCNGEEKYLVKWKGYPSEANTWEPIASFGTNLHLLNEFIEKRNRKIKSKFRSVKFGRNVSYLKNKDLKKSSKNSENNASKETPNQQNIEKPTPSNNQEILELSENSNKSSLKESEKSEENSPICVEEYLENIKRVKPQKNSPKSKNIEPSKQEPDCKEKNNNPKPSSCNNNKKEQNLPKTPEKLAPSALKPTRKSVFKRVKKSSPPAENPPTKLPKSLIKPNIKKLENPKPLRKLHMDRKLNPQNPKKQDKVKPDPAGDKKRVHKEASKQEAAGGQTPKQDCEKEERVSGSLDEDIPQEIKKMKMIKGLLCGLVLWKKRTNGVRPRDSFCIVEDLKKDYIEMVCAFYESKIKVGGH